MTHVEQLLEQWRKAVVSLIKLLSNAENNGQVLLAEYYEGTIQTYEACIEELESATQRDKEQS